MQRPPLPPFDEETALAKVKAAEEAWSSRDPARVAQAYTPESTWRNRAEFFQGREEIEDFPTRKWALELHYRLMVDAFDRNRPQHITRRYTGSAFGELRKSGADNE